MVANVNDETSRQSVEQIFSNAARDHFVYSSEIHNPSVYKDINTHIIVNLLTTPNKFKNKLRIEVGPVLLKLTNFLDRQAVGRIFSFAKTEPAMAASDHITSLSNLKVPMSRIAAIAKRIFGMMLARDRPDNRLTVLKQIFRFFANNSPNRDEWYQEEEVLTEDTYERLYRFIELFIRMASPLRESENAENVKGLLNAFGTQLSPATLAALKKVGLRVDAQESTLRGVLRDVKAELRDNRRRIFSIRRELETANQRLVEQNEKILVARRLRKNYELLGASFVETLNLPSKQNKDDMLSFLKHLNSKKNNFVVLGALGLVALAYTKGQEPFGIFSEQAIPLFAQNATVDVIVSTFSAPLLMQSSDTNNARFSAAWTQILDDAQQEDFAAISTPVFDYLSFRLGAATPEQLESLVNSSTAVEDEWVAAADDSNNLDAVVAKMKAIMVQMGVVSETELADYESLKKTASQLQESLILVNAKLETLERNRRVLDDQLAETSTSRSSVQQEWNDVRDQRQRVEREVVEALGSRVVDDLEAEDAELKQQEAKLRQQAKQLDNKNASLNGDLLSVRSSISKENAQTESILRQQNEVRERIEQAADRINEALREMKVPEIDDVTKSTTLTIDWFDRVKLSISEFYENDYKPLLEMYNQLQRDATTKEAQIKSLTAANLEYTQTENKLTSERDNLEQEVAKMKSAVSSMYARLLGAQPDVELTFEEKLRAIENVLPLEGKRAVVSAAVAANSLLQDEQFRLSSDMEETQQRIKELEAKVAELENTNGTLQPFTVSLQKDVAELNIENAQLSQQVMQLSGVIEELKSSEIELNVRIAQMRNEKNEIESDFAERLESISNANRAARSKNARLISRLSHRINAIETMKNSTGAVTFFERKKKEKEDILQSLDDNDPRIEDARENVERYTFLRGIFNDRKKVEGVLVATRSELAAARANAAELDDVRKELDDSLQRNYSDIDRQSQLLRELNARLDQVVQEKRSAEKELERQKIEMERQNQMLARMQQSLEAAKETAEDYRSKYERAVLTIQQQQDAYSKMMLAQQRASSAQQQLADKLNMSVPEVEKLTQVLTSDDDIDTVVNAIAPLVDELPSRFEAASSSISDDEDELVAASAQITAVGQEVVRAALDFDKNRTALKTQAQSFDVQIMSATEAPRFTRFVPASAPPRVEVLNEYSGESPGARLLSLDDSYDDFSSYMERIIQDEGIPYSTVDQFYVFASMVQGRVASVKPFWLNQHEGMRALVAHAIEAATTTSTSRVPISMFKERDSVRRAIVTIVKEELNNSRPENDTTVRAGYLDDNVITRLNASYSATFYLKPSTALLVFRDLQSFLSQLTNNITERLEVEQDGIVVRRPSHIAVAQYIKGLFAQRRASEIDQRRERTRSMNPGERVFSVLVSMLDKTFFAAFQTALQLAKVPLSFTDERFVRTLHDSAMADYVAVFYNQAFARSRHTVTAKRTTLFDTQASFVRTALQQYDPPNVDFNTSIRVKTEETSTLDGSDEDEGFAVYADEVE